MSIITRTGDQGVTGLMYNRRVSKSHPRVQAYGAVDEVNATIGLARAASTQPLVRETLLAVQQDLIVLMGELATAPEDLPRYVQDGYSRVSATMTERLEAVARTIEAQLPSLGGWAIPGSSVESAALDVARTVCRRAEREVCALQESGQLHNPEIIVFLNRLSDLLWLLARSGEGASESSKNDR